MTLLRPYIKPIIILIASVIICRFAYDVFKPIAFLFLACIVFCICFFLLNRRVNEITDGANWQGAQIRKILSVLFLVLIYFLSMKVLKDYQCPGGAKPYFTNASHHAIVNSGIGFDERLNLYEPESVTTGLYSSDTGTLEIQVKDQKCELIGRNYFRPVYFQHSEDSIPILVNNIYPTRLQKGYQISDALTSLTWTRFEVDHDKFNMELVFSTKDKEFLTGNTGLITDTIVINKLRMRLGKSLLRIIQEHTEGKADEQDAVLYRWLTKVGNIEIIKQGDEENTWLFLFPSFEIYQKYDVFVSGQPVREEPHFQTQLPFGLNFYIGTGRSKHSMNVISAKAAALKDISKKEFILRFDWPDRIPFFQIPNHNQNIGSEEIRFIKNTYSHGEVPQFREGFLFHREMKSNDETSINALIRYEHNYSHHPLDWSILGEYPKQEHSSFAVDSKSKQLTWFYSIEDLSKNSYTFLKMLWCLALVIFLMIVVVVVKPSHSLASIETPLFMIFYCFVVFRLLLLWRVATFPPLENVGRREFSDLTGYDGNATVIVVLVTLVLLIFIRFKPTTLASFSLFLRRVSNMSLLNNKVRSFLFLHCLILFVLGVLYNLKVFPRFTGIVFPLASYFFFLRAFTLYDIQFSFSSYHANPIIAWLQNFKRHWIETPVFFISMTTLLYLGLTDTGYAIIFFFFLLLKSVILEFSRGSIKRNGFLGPSNYILFGFLASLVVIAFLIKRSLVDFLISGEVFWILKYCVLGFILVTATVLFKGYAIKWLLVTIIGTFALVYIFEKGIQEKIDQKIRLTKYRASIVYKPVEEMLFENEYNSTKEQKIIETAQNQWFIHSYLRGVNFMDAFSSREAERTSLINFRPHFRTGVNYKTQTQDVVLPRFIIGEFGGFVMFLLLVSLALPLVLFLVSFRLYDSNKRLLPDSVTGLLLLLLLFTTGLMLWLTSTNRFVFFGQDFPFLSLISRISIVIPAVVFFFVLAMQPEPRQASKFQVVALLTFFAAISTFVLAPGKHKNLDEGYFKVNFDNVENNINGPVNDILSGIQNVQLFRSFQFPDENKARLLNDLSTLFNILYRNEKFNALMDTGFTKYEQSIFDKLKTNPEMGFKLNSPLHIKIREGKVITRFNRYWSLEVPPYDLKNIWKGDILEDCGNTRFTENLWIVNSPSFRLLRVPPGYVKDSTTYAILDLDNSILPSDYTLLYDKEKKKFRKLKVGDPAELIKSNDVVICFLNGHHKTFTASGDAQKYFAFNCNINGKQQMIYPLGKTFPWIRQWTNATKQSFELFENPLKLTNSTKIHLDYELTKDVGTYVNREFLKRSPDFKDLSFSIIMADGNGRIRLMVDFSKKRNLLDPNVELEILEEEAKSYFYIDNAKERIQWGNMNLLRLDHGPGSSFKPLLTAAVASQLKLEWSSIKLKGQVNSLLFTPNDELQYYANQKLRPFWKKMKVINDVNFDNYIVHSNNVFHSLIVFLGSYTEKDFLGNIGHHSLTNLLNPVTQSYADSCFPILELNGVNYSFKGPSGWPKSDDGNSYFGHRESLMNKGLLNNLILEIEPIVGTGERKLRSNFSKLQDSLVVHNTWAFPEHSYLLRANRLVFNDLPGSLNMGVRQTALGGGIYDITPIKMAEMYGKLTVMNPGFTMRLEGTSSTTTMWNVNDTWKNDYGNFHYGTLFGAMERVYTQGTAGKLKEFVTANENKQYIFYAKTGTTGIESDKRTDSKRLAVIISKGPISQNTNAKFIVLYFTLNDTKDNDNSYWPHYGKIIDYILTSKSVKEYMEN